MTLQPKIALRLQFLVRVVRKECQHLTTTDQRLFGSLFTLELAIRLESDPDFAERVEAFVSRFGRLQDTVGDKLLPLLLDPWVKEHPLPSTILNGRSDWSGSNLLTSG